MTNASLVAKSKFEYETDPNNTKTIIAVVSIDPLNGD